MKAVPRRYRRLIALGVLSLLLHMLAIETIGRVSIVPVVKRAPAAPLALRLQAAPPPLPISRIEDGAGPAAAPAPPRALAQAAPARARPVHVPGIAPDGSSDEGMVDVPSRFRVSVPASATLDYVLTRPDGTQEPVQIAWQKTGTTYTVAADGVTGQMAGSGVIGDNGIEPKQAQLRRTDGSEVVAAFASNGITIDARQYPNQTGSQDPASLLLQLMGMGRSRPDQLRGTVALYVVTADGPVVMQLKVGEDEDLATPLGSFVTRHLVQVVKAGEPRLELWLAPERNWLPVQLRLTAPDGTASTQAITRIVQDDADQ